MSPLALLTAIALGLVALALVLWVFLLLFRVVENRRILRRQAHSQQWLQRLLVVLEEQAAVETLPAVRSTIEMETVLGLLRDLAERFRGQYRSNLSEVLRHIGAETYALSLLGRRRETARIRGCALLAWTGPNDHADARLAAALEDRSPNVRLEAAYALALRHAASASLTSLFSALRGTPAIHSNRVRDIIRLQSPTRAAEIATLLDQAESFREKVLLLEGLAESGDLTQSARIATFLRDVHPLVRSAAVQALEQLADPRHESDVLKLAADRDRRVRLRVAKYVSAMAGPSGGERVLEDLTSDPDFDVQRAAVYGLVKLGGERLKAFRAASNPPLVEALLTEAAHALSGETLSLQPT